MLWWFGQNAVVAAALAAMVWSACRFSRIGPATRHALWLVVLVKLITPPVLTWPWPASLDWLGTEPVDCPPSVASPGESIASVAQGQAAEHAFSPVPVPSRSGQLMIDWPAIDRPAALALSVTEPTSGTWLEEDERIRDGDAPSATSQTQQSAVFDAALSFGQQMAQRCASMVAPCWLAGTAVMILIHLARIIRFRRTIRQCERPRLTLVRRVTHIAATLGVRVPQVVVASGIRSPLVWGGWRARLVWPKRLPQGFETGRWDGVIAHELAHLRRRDHWVGWLELGAGCLWWWNPLFWYVRHELRENAELACDALVVWALPDGRRRYAESLIEVVSHFSSVAAPAPACGVDTVARQAFERRLTMILCERVPCKLSLCGLVAIGLLAVVSLPGWTVAQGVATTRAEEPAAAAAATTASEPAVAGQATVPTNSPVTFYTVETANPATQSSEDARMDALEKKLDALIAEVQALRANRATSAGAANQPRPKQVTQPYVAGTNMLQARTLDPSVKFVAQPVQGFQAPPNNVQMLSRATYELPKAKAEALAAFLKEHMKTSVEAAVKEDGEKTTLTITATPDAQGAIGQFIAVSEGKTSGTVNWVVSGQNQLGYRVISAGEAKKTPQAEGDAGETKPTLQKR